MSCWWYYSGVNKWTYHQHLAHFYKQKSILLFKATVMLATLLRLKMTVLPPYRISCRQGMKRGPADLQLGLVGSGLGSVGLGSVCKKGNKTVNKKERPNRTDTVKPRIEAPGFYLYKCPWPRLVTGTRCVSGTRLLSVQAAWTPGFFHQQERHHCATVWPTLQIFPLGRGR